VREEVLGTQHTAVFVARQVVSPVRVSQVCLPDVRTFRIPSVEADSVQALVLVTAQIKLGRSDA